IDSGAKERVPKQQSNAASVKVTLDTQFGAWYQVAQAYAAYVNVYAGVESPKQYSELYTNAIERITALIAGDSNAMPIANYEKVLSYLDALNIEYEIDQRLVRGLDYYTDTVFEVVSTNPESGSQATIFAGGRYDNLVKEMGGPELSGIGFALGEERLMIALEAENALPEIEKVCDVYVIDLTGGDPYALQTAEALRKAGYVTELNLLPRSLKSQFKSVDRKKAAVTVIVGEDEIANKVVQVKNNQTKEQKSMTIEELIENLDRKEEEYA
ncbi:MAG: ATP phosphoribosyltransferase regulatory subunit, partial [Erysipelotrichaceae bacterium]|nr:ATP phosphoribosyltransferase regulatory subunit [Erysipelotrichaceae bacterium]